MSRSLRDRPMSGGTPKLNVLVTGAAGYIGSICAGVLLARGMRVGALDSLLEGHRAAGPPGAIFCETDLGDRAQIVNVFSQHKIDAAMHFAGEALVAKSVREPSTFYAANIACGVNLLDALTRHNVKKFIFSSTAATYGEPHTVPIPEDHSKVPINPYGKSKLRFEELLADYRQKDSAQDGSAPPWRSRRPCGQQRKTRARPRLACLSLLTR